MYTMEMVHVQGGTFQFGDKHTVTISDFEIGKYPVTQKQWREIMGKNPSHFKGDDLPVESVSWDDVQVFLKALNERLPGKNYRLPSEAEWEYAARGGRLSRGYEYAGSNDLNEVGWYWENSGNMTHPVGQLKPNELGLYDMSGNVNEWCEDDWHDNYQDVPADGRAWVNSLRSSYRVLRGGSWFDVDDYCRSAVRSRFNPAGRDDVIGFRVSRHLE